VEYDQYRKFIKPFCGILKNVPTENEAFQAHFNLINLKFENFEVFKSAFMEHLKGSDWFPSHLDIYKHGEEISKIIHNREQLKIPEAVEYKRLKKLEAQQLDDFIRIVDKNSVDEYRERLFKTQEKVKSMEEKSDWLKELKF